MKSFDFYSPTEVVFGKGGEQQVGALVKKWGGKKVLLHYGGKSAEKSGLLDRVKASLKAEGIPFVSLGGVQPNPRLSLIYEGIELCKAEGVDFILAVGGGSTIDSAKAIGVGLGHPDEDVWEFYFGKQVQKMAPVGVVLTIAAAGSETSNSSVVTKVEEDGTHVKRSIDQDAIRPKFAVMNPELIYTLPKYQIGCGIADIIMHTLERYFSAAETLGNDLTDRIAESVLKTMIQYGPQYLATPDDYKAASEVMWAGSISHNNMTGCGNGGDFATHLIGHELSARYDAAHGATLTAVWGAWARYVMSENVLRFAQYAVNVWGCDFDSADPERTALAGIACTEKFFASIGMPINIPQIQSGVTEEDMAAMADMCVSRGRTAIGGFKKLSRDDVYNIYVAANR
ncbi:iron-containing alcohol dehydrogenase [Christensenellaceae bacterium NSJ-44]|uniref:Iron-containing alcohol dehydrogenase n=1 Tax=Luoshenia tenuis TaxID=2763654 RepID=A0A926HP29_9FIRM|nr:iron-containing alcohol dehydrogenase [Luoshenia tenuis]